jgi:hypothetical protein
MPKYNSTLKIFSCISSYPQKKNPVPYDLFAKAFLKDLENLKGFLSTFLPEHIKTHLDLDSLKIIPEEQVSLSPCFTPCVL